MSDSGADSVTQLCTQSVWRHHPLSLVLVVSPFLGSVWVFYWLSAASSPPCVLLGQSVMLCHSSCSSLRAWLSSSRSPWAPTWCSSTELSPGGEYGMEWHERVTLLRCLLDILGFFSTTASVTVTPEWLHSSRDERQILKWPGTPCSQQKQLWCKPLLCWVFFFLGGGRKRRNTWCVSGVLMVKKKIISNFKVEGVWCRPFWGTSCPLSLSPLSLSFPVNIPSPGFLPGSSESRLSAICLSAEGCFCQF